jgi:ABC-2 type transport system permease protein
VTAFAAMVQFTGRGLLGRRRVLLLLLLAALPVLVGLLIRLGGGSPNAANILDALGIRTVLPLVALVIGTAVVGSEVDDGTIVYLLTKPIPRWLTALAKILVATVATVVITLPPLVLTGILVGGVSSDAITLTVGYAVAAALGGIAYASVFTALGSITSRALLLGLGYTLIWEGVVAGLLEGTRYLSIRQATLGVAAAMTGTHVGRLDPLPLSVSVGMLVIAIVGGFLVTTYALRRFEVRGGD